MNYLKISILFCVFLSAKPLLFTNISTSPEPFCQVPWLHFASNENCVNIIGNSVPKCIYRAFSDANIRIRAFGSFDRIRPLVAANRSDCEYFLQTSDDLEGLKMVFNRNAKFFYTFTHIHILNLFKGNQEVKDIFNENEIRYIYENALNVYIIDVKQTNLSHDQTYIEFNKCRNVLTGAELNLNRTNSRILRQFYDNQLNHPMLDVKNSRNNFTITFFNCSPLFIYFEDEFKNRRCLKTHKSMHLLSFTWLNNFSFQIRWH